MIQNYGKTWTTPVLILGCKLGALAIMRTLGQLGVPIYGVNENETDSELRSKYLKQYFIKDFNPTEPADYLDYVLALSKIIGEKTILIPTSDDLSVFVAENSKILSEHYMFPVNSGDLLDRLSNKQSMFEMALEHQVPTPDVIAPKNIEEVNQALPELQYPIMLKAIDGNKLMERTGKKMVVVQNESELLEHYHALENPDDPNLMFQELIPGDDDQVYIFNGYFNEESDCLSAFTGHKVRQFPVHIGCASLGECRWHERVAEKTIRLMKAIDYRGILDIGYRLDPRDDKYKVLDINPRVGQAFRIFVAENNMDVIRSLYLDLTGQTQPDIIPREGRRWIIEDYDLISSYDYYTEGTLKFMDWIKSFKNLEEGAWFSLRDPMPFLVYIGKFTIHGIKWCFKKLTSK